MPSSFWAKSVSIACALRNLTAVSSYEARTPVEILNSHKPHVRTLRVFGCEAWIHVPKRKKLEVKAGRGVVLRSLPHEKYRIWDIVDKVAYEKRHVITIEEVIPWQQMRSRESNRSALDEWYRSLDLVEKSNVDDDNHPGNDNDLGLGDTALDSDESSQHAGLDIDSDDGAPLDGSHNHYQEDQENDVCTIRMCEEGEVYSQSTRRTGVVARCPYCGTRRKHWRNQVGTFGRAGKACGFEVSFVKDMVAKSHVKL